MWEFLKERKVLKQEKNFFEMLKLSLNRDLSLKEQSIFLKAVNHGINYLEEEFKTVRMDSTNTSKDYITINNGLTLISDLKEGFIITEENFIKENIFQLSAHYQSVKEYELDFLNFRSDNSNKNFHKTIDTFMESKSYKDGYQKQKTLTKNS